MRTFIAFLMVVSSLAFAQTEPAAKRKAQIIEFQPHELGGDRQLPSNTYVLAKDKRKFDSLIKRRANFNDKLAASVDAL